MSTITDEQFERIGRRAVAMALFMLALGFCLGLWVAS